MGDAGVLGGLLGTLWRVWAGPPRAATHDGAGTMVGEVEADTSAEGNSSKASLSGRRAGSGLSVTGETRPVLCGEVLARDDIGTEELAGDSGSARKREGGAMLKLRSICRSGAGSKWCGIAERTGEDEVASAETWWHAEVEVVVCVETCLAFEELMPLDDTIGDGNSTACGLAD